MIRRVANTLFLVPRSYGFFKDNRAKLFARLAGAEKEVEKLKSENESLRNSLATKEAELSDHVIKIRVSFVFLLVGFCSFLYVSIRIYPCQDAI